MTAATLVRTPSLFDVVDGERVHDAVIVGAWEALTAEQTVPCPVCRSTMEPLFSAHARPVGGRCSDCGAALR